jgi:hypothetical protein
MTIATGGTDQTIGIIPIHFDVPQSHLPLKTFIEIASRTQTIVDCINKEVFGNQVKCEVWVIPPKPGSFLTILGIFVSAYTAGKIWEIFESDIGKGFVKGLTGKEPREYSEAVGEWIRDALTNKENAELKLRIEPAFEIPKDAEGSYPVAPQLPEYSVKMDADHCKEVVSLILVEATVAILSVPSNELNKRGINSGKFHDAIVARNEFYKTCLSNKDVMGIGYSEKEEFPIPRNLFATMYLEPTEPESSDGDSWRVEVVTFTVTSPNWDREDKQRKWKAKESTGRERFFIIEDGTFWEMAKRDRLDLHPADKINVQWAYKEGPSGPKDGRVIRVLDYNETKLADALSGDALSALLGTFDNVHSENDGDDLFSFL